ncbi:hypothetical protein Tco_0153176, partial [Tanacetum coccineum]
IVKNDLVVKMQIAENDLVVKKFPENDLVVKKFPENDLVVKKFPENHSNLPIQPELPRFITNPHNNDTRSVDELARDKAGEDNDVREDNQQSGGDYSEDEEGDNEEVQDESEESD